MVIERKLVVEKRTELGTAACRRLRKRGVVPGNVYGHGRDPLLITVSEEPLDAIVHAGHKVIDFEVDGTVEKAMFREVQWDTFGMRIQHFDLIRIVSDERVTVEILIELRGVAPGTRAGGVLEQLRSLTVECLAFEIPDSIRVRIGDLEVGQAIHVKELPVPAGVKVLADPEQVVVMVMKPRGEEEVVPEAAEEGPKEPERIGEKLEPEEEAPTDKGAKKREDASDDKVSAGRR